MTGTASPLLTLDYLTAADIMPADFVDIAADAGFAAVSLISQGNARLPMHRLAVGDRDTEALVERLAARGLFVNNMDGLYVTELMDWEDVARIVAVTRHLGARRGVAMVFDAEPGRARETLGRLAQIYAQAGLGLALEPAPMSAVPTLADAAAILAQVGLDIGLIADAMHLMQAGEMPVDIAAFAGQIVGGQIADAPSALSEEQYRYAASFERLAPGDGDLPLRAFLAALPASAPVGIEVPQKSLVRQGASHLERVLELKRRTTALLAATGRTWNRNELGDET